MQICICRYYSEIFSFQPTALTLDGNEGRRAEGLRETEGVKEDFHRGELPLLVGHCANKAVDLDLSRETTPL